MYTNDSFVRAEDAYRRERLRAELSAAPRPAGETLGHSWFRHLFHRTRRAIAAAPAPFVPEPAHRLVT